MPHSQLPNYIRAGPWDSIGKKNARQVTIIDTYRRFFDKHIPADKQFWSMCGAHFNAKGLPLLGELGFLLKNGLVDKNRQQGHKPGAQKRPQNGAHSSNNDHP